MTKFSSAKEVPVRRMGESLTSHNITVLCSAGKMLTTGATLNVNHLEKFRFGLSQPALWPPLPY